MMSVLITCEKCGSGIHVAPTEGAEFAHCDICSHDQKVSFNHKHIEGVLEECPVCSRKDFYSQKDFNRKIGVLLFVIAAILSLWTYGISFIVLYLFDLLLFRKLNLVAVCYKCNTIFRDVKNIKEIHPFNHEMNDRIVYANEDFQGKQLHH